jgi:hypothetical protein
MRRIVLVVLALGLFASFGWTAHAADLDLYRKHPRVSDSGDFGSYDQRIRVVEQVLYCGDCEAPIALSRSRDIRLHYVGYPVWPRGCAVGGCYGYYDIAPSCYWRDAMLPDGRGGWTAGVEKVCDFP